MSTPFTSILSSMLSHLNASTPSLCSFSLRLSDGQVVVADAFIQALLDEHATTLSQFTFVNCSVGIDSIAAICRKCIGLERLEVTVTVKDLVSVHMHFSFAITVYTPMLIYISRCLLFPATVYRRSRLLHHFAHPNWYGRLSCNSRTSTHFNSRKYPIHYALREKLEEDCEWEENMDCESFRLSLQYKMNHSSGYFDDFSRCVVSCRVAGFTSLTCVWPLRETEHLLQITGSFLVNNDYFAAILIVRSVTVDHTLQSRLRDQFRRCDAWLCFTCLSM